MGRYRTKEERPSRQRSYDKVNLKQIWPIDQDQSEFDKLITIGETPAKTQDLEELVAFEPEDQQMQMYQEILKRRDQKRLKAKRKKEALQAGKEFYKKNSLSKFIREISDLSGYSYSQLTKYPQLLNEVLEMLSKKPIQRAHVKGSKSHPLVPSMSHRKSGDVKKIRKNRFAYNDRY